MRAFLISIVAALALAGCNTTTGNTTPLIVSQADDLATRKISQLMLDEGIASGIADSCPQYAVRPNLESRVTSAIGDLLDAGYSLPQVERTAEQAAAAMDSPATTAAIEAYALRQLAAAGPGADVCDLAANEVRSNTPVGQLLVRR